MSYQLEHHAPPSRVIYFDSRDCFKLSTSFTTQQPISSHFQYIFEGAIVVPPNVDTLISLHTASLPYSFYNIRDGINDRLDFEIGQADDFDETKTPLFIDINEGNYTISSLLDRLKIELRLAILVENVRDGSVMRGKMENPVFNFEYIKFKLKIVLSFDSISTKNLELRFLIASGVNKDRGIRAELGLQINDQQGFIITNGGQLKASNPIYDSGIISPTDIYLQYKFMSPNAIDISNSVRGVYVRTNLTSISTLDTLTGGFSSILARIPIKVNSGGVIFYKPSESTHKAVVKTSLIKAIQIKLTDDRNRQLDFNGLNLTLSIQFDFVYSKKAIEPLTALESRIYRHTDDRPPNTTEDKPYNYKKKVKKVPKSRKNITR